MKKIKIYILLCILPLIMTACSMSEKSDTGDIGNDISGRGGSLARFTIAGDYLYTVDQSALHTISLTDVEHPKKIAEKSIGIYTETIFPYQNSLLLGTETGMLVYSLSNPSSPEQIANFQHIRSCDPVVAQNGYAYITLNTANQRCSRGMNELQIVDISNLNAPQIVKSMSLSTPLGLDINNDTLYVCDNGLRVLNVADKQNPVELNYFNDIAARDVIFQQKSIIVIGTDGLHQYRYSGGILSKISTIPITF
jgi:hypothetical protein